MNRTLALAVITTIALGAAPALANQGAACVKVDEADLKQRTDRWSASLVSGTADAVTLWYTPDARVHLALKDQPVTDTKALRSFYEDIMIKGASVEIKERKLEIGCNSATETGRYVYKVKGQPTEATYRKVYEPRDGVWLIREHTSAKL